MPARAPRPRQADPIADLADLLSAMDPDAFEDFARTCTPEDLDLIEQVMTGLTHREWTPMPHQVPPDPNDPTWYLWLLLGGRGTGKTDACADAMNQHVKGPACDLGVPGGHRMAIIAPTLGDASEACVNGPTGLRAHNPGIREVTRKGGTFVIWPNGSEAKLMGAYTKQDVERLRAGGNRCFVWCEELAAWRYLRACYNHMVLGNRLGHHPRVVASTTPKNRPQLRKLIGEADTRISKARTSDNPHLERRTRDRYERLFSGTRLGRQELDGELLDDVEGALWTVDLIEKGRPQADDEIPSRFRRIVVGVDPSWGTTNDECGIVVAGRGWDDHAYVIGDYSIRGGPMAWANAAVTAYHTHAADALVVEQNFQGEQVRLAMLTVSHDQGRPPVKFVNASRGKHLRAEPIVLLYEQEKVHHLHPMPKLEDQMTRWVPNADTEADDGEDGGDITTTTHPEHEGDQDDNTAPSDFSPDRIDALVFAITDLMLTDGGEGGTLTIAVGRLPKASERRRRRMVR